MTDDLESRANINVNCPCCKKVTVHEYVRDYLVERSFKGVITKRKGYEYRCQPCGNIFKFIDQRINYNNRINSQSK